MVLTVKMFVSAFGLPNVKTDINVVPEAPITSTNVDKMNAYQMAVDYYAVRSKLFTMYKVGVG